MTPCGVNQPYWKFVGALLSYSGRMTPATYAFSFIPDYVLPEVPAGTSGGMFFDFPSFGITKNVYIYSIICLPVQYYRIFL